MMFGKGKTGEDRAARYLQQQGYRILERNYHCRAGELDIIAEKDEIVVLVEVKLRTGKTFGAGYESVGRAKQEKLIKAALHYASAKNVNRLMRFDVISIDGDAITHIVDAFTA